MNKAYYEGYEDGLEGEYQNPYEWDSDEFCDYEDGYEEGRYKAEELY